VPPPTCEPQSTMQPACAAAGASGGSARDGPYREEDDQSALQRKIVRLQQQLRSKDSELTGQRAFVRSSCCCVCVIRVRLEIMGPGKCGIVGKSQSALMMINPIIFTRTRTITHRRLSRVRLPAAGWSINR
jgi:hypothetical protein